MQDRWPAPAVVRVRAYAKINLHLRIGPRRPDGYHEIDSVLHRISWRDDLELRWRGDGAVRLAVEPAGAAPGGGPAEPEAGAEAGPEPAPARWVPSGPAAVMPGGEALPGAMPGRGDALGAPLAPPVPSGPDNLAWRAARLLQQALDVAAGVDIRLVKRVAAGAGLGGGSADAAAVLRGLRRLWRLAVDGATLRRLGDRLGADVPFLLGGRAARVRGKGERIQVLPSWPGLALVLVPLPRPVSTAWAYGEWDRRCGEGQAGEAFADGGAVARAVARRDLHSLARLVRNDFEAVVAAAFPEVAEALERMRREGAVVARMSGSGPVVWGIFPHGEAAQKAWRRLRRCYPGARLARTL
ncbi:4-(cytidine 5'-diphospho)-2-C-methyl-D-erythritol kinase [Thermaerobacter subterraneus]|uniref:4-diphosphocytidyl-2-C-methyl-D-erythritol kinase n=1 Tax=Thermaerobacter subterraneus DSM 13965 TaxID=867903 RepID=K6QDG8_9FIRM|nr:4-(cytidine 5'-diphospho)-2-C-methyl-D-erythritol kinase [Thermaerobacter subterraneus]EKP94731.1 4-diphosphocytidyl-2-C-methyl-D-erythritol kinase [Thermaerobacter subterraneus DSM 13965]